MFPFTIRLFDRPREDSNVQPVKVKIDPGVKTTGMILVRSENKMEHIIHLPELTHQGAVIRKELDQRSNYGRRRKTVNWISFLSRSQTKIDQIRLQNATRFLEGKRSSLASKAAVTASKSTIFFRLKALGLPVACSPGGKTKYNRFRLNIPKTHCLDAACTDKTDSVSGWKQNVLLIKAMGRGSYQRTLVDKYGFPRGTLMAQKTVKGFATGDMVKVKIPSSKKKGAYFGRVAVRKFGSFNIQTNTETVQGIS